MRALGIHLPGLSRKTFDRKPYPPGMHGAQNARAKKSAFGQQLIEKQKLRFNFGLTESSLKKIYKDAIKSRENTGLKILELLELRLDNIVFRAGLAPTIPAGRQLVRHNHVLVNGKRVNIPSYRAKVGDIITLKEKSAKLPVVAQALEAPSLAPAPWISTDKEKAKATVITLPTRDSFPFQIEISSVVEFYSR